MKPMISVGAFVSSFGRLAPIMPKSKTINTVASKVPSRALHSVSSGTEAVDNIFVGDFAGQSATFSSVDGKLIPVPEHFVPESMIEWGQIPSCFECIVSEDILQDEKSGGASLERNTVNVMPEVGCGLDNLDTMATKETIPVSFYHFFSFDNDVKLATAFIEDKRRMECVFMMKVGNNSDEEPEIVRKRVSINLHENNQMQSPFEIVKERKTSNESTRGTIAKGGGLHASTVASLVGKENSSKPFGLQKTMDISLLEGTWDSLSTGEKIRLDHEFWSGEKSKSFSLPEDIVVRNCEDPPSLEVCMLIHPGSDVNKLNRVGVKKNLGGNKIKLEYIHEVKL